MTSGKHMQNQGEHAVDDVVDKASNVRQSVQDLGSAARDAARQVAGQVRDTAAERAAGLRDAAIEHVGEASAAAGEYYDMGRERALEFEQSLEDRIRERPLQSVLVAAGVGMLMGIVWMRR